MWAVFDRYYVDVDRARFDADLDRKQDVIVLRDAADASVQGFSTLATYDGRMSGRAITLVFSGDTVIDRAYWGQSALHLHFTRYVVLAWLRHPWRPLWWLLITKGWRTYLLLAKFFVRFWPRSGRTTPPEVRETLDALGRRLWPDAWQPDAGILHFSTPQGRLREGVAPVDPAVMDDPDVACFLERNPGHEAGDELVCLGHVSLGFALYTLWKLARRRRGRPGR